MPEPNQLPRYFDRRRNEMGKGVAKQPVKLTESQEAERAEKFAWDCYLANKTHLTAHAWRIARERMLALIPERIEQPNASRHVSRNGVKNADYNAMEN